MPLGKTFAALLPLELSRQTGRTVDLYNEGMPWRSPHFIALHFNDVLAAKPDMILWALTAGDLSARSGKVNLLPISDRKNSFLVRAWHRVKAAYAAGSFMDLIRYIYRHTRTATLLTHFLYSSQSQLVKASIMTGGYMSEPTLEQKRGLKQFDQDSARMETQAMNAGVPLVTVLLPDHGEADMILTQDLPSGVDPYSRDKELRSIITSHGGTYIDIFSDLRNKPDLQRGYFIAEGHPNALGHAIFTEVLAQELTNGSVPALKVAAQPSGARSC